MAADAADGLPHPEHAIVELRRIRDHSLNKAHPSSGPKSKFFMAHWFAATDWDLLRTSLIQHGRTNGVVRRVETA